MDYVGLAWLDYLVNRNQQGIAGIKSRIKQTFPLFRITSTRIDSGGPFDIAAPFASQNDVKWCHHNFRGARDRDFNGGS